MSAKQLTVASSRVSTNAAPNKPAIERLAKYFVLVACCCLVPTPARAEMLLAEISFTAPEPVVAPASFRFGVGNSIAVSPNFRVWIETVPSFPFMSMADATTLAEFDRLLPFQVAMDHVSFGLSNGPYEMPRPSPTSQFWLERAFEGAYTDIGVTATRYVEPIGVSYTLTAVERNVTPTVQTIRIFGNPDPTPDIPEPTTAMLVLCTALLNFRRCRSCLIRA